MIRHISSLPLFVLLLAACTGSSPEKKTGEVKSQTITAYDLDQRLREADSLVLVFYKDPYSADSLRYTRFYKQVSVTDKAAFKIMDQQLSARFDQQPLKPCRSEGKIWCFSKGKIFQTVYFNTDCSRCCFFYLIKDGNFFYSLPAAEFSNWVNALKPLAKEPSTESSQ